MCARSRAGTLTGTHDQETPMNDRLAVDAQARVAERFAAQQHAFAEHPYPSLEQRRRDLRALKKQLAR